MTIVVDRRRGSLLAAFIAGPGAAEAIHEAVLAVKTEIPIEVLADTIHAFPTVARVMGGLFVTDAQEVLEQRDRPRRAASRRREKNSAAV